MNPTHGGRLGTALLLALALPACSATAGPRAPQDRPADIRYDEAAGRWTLTSGPAELVLRRRQDHVVIEYLGPARPAESRGKSWDTPEFAGRLDGVEARPEDLSLESHDIGSGENGLRTLCLKSRWRSLKVQVHYAAWGDTGVFTRYVTATNSEDQPVRLESLPSLALSLPPGPYELTHLYGGWGRERQVAVEPLGPGRREFVNRTGRSTNGHSPWFFLKNGKTGIGYLGQFAWSGNWQAAFERIPTARPLESEPLRVEMGMRFDHGGALTLDHPGREFVLPGAAFTAVEGDVDDAANRLHRFQRRLVPRGPANDPLLVQFNSWYPFPGRLRVDDMKRCADIAAELGAEVFVLDAGWFNRKNWSREIGDWKHDPVAFPNGVEELAGHVHGIGLKFGIWVEIENLGVDSQMIKEHPEWCLSDGRGPLKSGERHHLDFGKPEVRQWARDVVDRLAKSMNLDWIKIDYNIDVKETFEVPGGGRPGDLLYRHLTNYYGWLDGLRAAHPGLVIENCSSGGLRFDLGILIRTHTTWISDEVKPIPSLQLAYGSTLEFLPEACNHWMVGDRDNGTVVTTNPPGWWDFMFRVPMNGQFGISSKVFQWTPELKERAKVAVAAYKRIRKVIQGADTYHLTPAPAHDKPTGWMAIQYVQPDRSRSVLMAYRLAGGSEKEAFKLRGLDPGRSYRVAVEGQDRGSFPGRRLSEEGLTVALDAEWRAAIVDMMVE
jgi:alpha-galactosidase